MAFNVEKKKNDPSSTSFPPGALFGGTSTVSTASSESGITPEGGITEWERTQGFVMSYTKLQGRVDALEIEQKKYASFIEAATRLSQTSRRAITFLMIVPAIQLLLAIVVVYILGLDEKMHGWLKLIIGGFGLSTIGELILYFKNMKSLQERVDKIEAKLEKD